MLDYVPAGDAIFTKVTIIYLHLFIHHMLCCNAELPLWIRKIMYTVGAAPDERRGLREAAQELPRGRAGRREGDRHGGGPAHGTGGDAGWALPVPLRHDLPAQRPQGRKERTERELIQLARDAGFHGAVRSTNIYGGYWVVEFTK